MTREIRRIASQEEFNEFAPLYLNAYPGAQATPDAVARSHYAMAQDPTVQFWSVYENGQLVGGMQTFDFRLNYFGRFISAGGIGGVWVDFLHKKQGIAKDLVTFFLDRCERTGAYLALLYPFRPDFYRQMGFGYGTRQEHYSFAPASLPASDGPHGVVYLTEEDAPLLQAFRNEMAARQHGQIAMADWERQRLFATFGARKTLVGYKEDGRLRGYLAYRFKRYDNNFVKNDLLIREWVVDDPETLLRFCTFLRSQADQIHRIEFDTQEDGFYFLPNDVRDGSDALIPSVYHQSNTAGIGLMYRIVNTRSLLAATTWRNYNWQTLNLILRVTDTFRPANSSTYYLRFRDGVLNLSDEPLVGIELEIDIAELSALLMGSASIEALYRFGRARVNPDHLPTLARLFLAERPTCLTAF